MQIQVTDGYITGYATMGSFPDGIDVSDEFIDDLDESKICFYKYENGQAVFDEVKYNLACEEILLQEIRARRESECFPIVNRGQAWYNLLTEQQRIELEVWYQAWLNAPETKVVPDKLEWIE